MTDKIIEKQLKNLNKGQITEQQIKDKGYNNGQINRKICIAIERFMIIMIG